MTAPGHEARQPDATLIALLAKAQDGFTRLRSGKADCIKSIAQAENVTSSYVTRVIYLAFLAPDIVKTIMTGKQPSTLSAQRLIQSVPLPLHWPKQRALLGFDHCSTTP